MSLTYSSWSTSIASLTAIPLTNADLVIQLPNAIDYAEQRIYRELNMLVEDIRDGSASTTAGVRNFTLPTSIGTFQTISEINIITPASTAPESGTRNPCTPVSLSVLDFSWPSSTGAAVPNQFAYFSQSSVAGQSNIVFGPWPSSTYRVEVVGKIIPTPLSSTNTTTFLTLYLPDLFLAATMIYLTGFMKNWGAQADDPRSGLSWDKTYNDLLKSASDWEARKRFAGASWTSQQVEPTALPQRG